MKDFKLRKNDVFYLSFAIALTITWIILFEFRWAPIIIASISSIPRVLLQLHDLKEDYANNSCDNSISTKNVELQNSYGYLTIVIWGVIEFGLEIMCMWSMNHYFGSSTFGYGTTLLCDGIGYIVGFVVFIIANVICLRKQRHYNGFFLVEAMYLLVAMCSVFIFYFAIIRHSII